MSKRIVLAAALALVLSGMAGAQAAEIVPVYFDDPDEGYNDTTPVAPVGGNPGTTLGEQRRIVAEFAADLWGAVLTSDQPIFIQANFTPLGPNVLGSAGATRFTFSSRCHSSTLIASTGPGSEIPAQWTTASR